MTEQPQSGTSTAPMRMTEQDVREKLESEGYTDVSNLKEGSNGVWMDKAMHGGKELAIDVDENGQ